MSLSKKGLQTSETKLGSSSKAIALNPNAAEFVPFSLRSPSSVNTGNTDATARFLSSGSSGKPGINRSESSVSNNSDDEAHQFWRRQLPDDITPDFKFMGDDESQGLGGLSLAGLSLHDDSEAARFSTSAGSGYVLNDLQELAPHQLNGHSFTEKLRFTGSSLVDNTHSAGFLSMPTKPWDKQVVNDDQLFGSSREMNSYNGTSRNTFINDVFAEHGIVDDMDTSPLDFLALHFPGFAADSLAEVYYANGCDLSMTIEMLTQLELQIDGAFTPNLNSKTLSAPNLSAIDFPALSLSESQSVQQKYAGDDVHQNSMPYRSTDKDNLLLFKSSSSFPSRGAIDFASAVKKMPSQDSNIWKYDRNGSANSNIGSSRNSQGLAGAYNSGHGRGIYGDRLQSRASARSSPVWLETGEAVANMYSELREEARDHARLRNVYLEQARRAYLVGNKALAKELSVKGQLHGMHMKAAHGKAQESIYRQRNPVPMELQGDGRGKERMIDLHGLHVTEAIHMLKNELSMLRTAARAADQRLQVYICVGTGHHTRGSRTPARLPVAVQRYLLEEEGLEYSEPQAGLLRVVIY
ncbi:polyadenylate-binding protein-interacting protein 7 [Rhodamnia argentea]|uniref:Polyadenylate-binding protein-interacting protein 7 n=1 Tax=Rhodamnia argentea TaxID=178133 RepID=A0A8B8P9C4_9MYRT|nr:polyadenylate-binding protein-interacting protein 7 [Rhodamnia argentea]XP_048133315.1 polyadenylate-binding protein-interacting protein 7 [Rhodamnia argentea]